MNNLPLVSCICPTFGKIKHLNEAVQSFLIQDYSNKELIIFNNYPGTNISYSHPQVKVINYKEPIASMGQYRNVPLQWAKGKYICTWDDDDISLSKRISSQIESINSETNYKGCTLNAYYSEQNNILKKIDIFFSSSMIEREYLLQNPYDSVDGEDVYMFNKMVKEGVMGVLPLSTPQYIYRWGTGTYHVSGLVHESPEQKREEMLRWADNLNLPQVIKLTPYWERDYQEDVNNFNQNG